MFVLQVCREILGSRLSGITNIRGVYDFKSFLQGVRPRSADKDIKSQYSLQFKTTEDVSAIVVRSKAAVDLHVDFGPWNTMLPNPRRPDAIPHRDAVPPVCAAKDWSEFEDDIVPSLLRFYNDEFRHPVHIPDADKEEMLEFLTHGLDPPTPPAWIAWDDTDEAENQVVSTIVPVVSATTADNRRRRPVWRPFLQPRQNACVCGSRTHQRTSHRDCPMNPSRVDPAPESEISRGSKEDVDDENAESDEFPFPVGTWVCFEFDDGMYPGTITHLYPGEDLCMVEFADGDKADYDGDEIHYAVQLYQREFNT